jgi:hypothetical protein
VRNCGTAWNQMICRIGWSAVRQGIELTMLLPESCMKINENMKAFDSCNIQVFS